MISKREQNAARIKFEALSFVLEETTKRNFSDIQVIEICKHVGVSKVTFFKYFKSKIDLLLYYKSVFTLQLIIATTNYDGMEALKEVVRSFASEYQTRPSMLLGLLHYFTDSVNYVSPIAVKPAERLLFFPEVVEGFEILSLESLIERFMLEVVFARNTDITSDSRQLAELFLATLYGTIIVCRMQKKEHVPLFFATNMSMVFPGLKG